MMMAAISDDTSYARFGVKGETQITNELTGYGQFEYNLSRQMAQKAMQITLLPVWHSQV